MNQCQKSNSPILNISIPSEEIGRRTLNLTEIGANFACFKLLKIFRETSNKIADRNYITEHTQKHRAKFRADRPTELRGYAARKLKIGGKIQRESVRRRKSDWKKLGLGVKFLRH